MQLKKRLERTDNSPLHQFPCIFLKFHCHFSTKFCLIILSFGDCVHAGWQRCFWKNTKRQASTFDFLTQYSDESKSFLSHVVTGNETWVSHEAPKSKQQSMEWRHTSLPTKTNFKWTTSNGRLCAQCFGTEKAFCLWTSCPKASQSMQVSIATHLKNCAV